MSAIAPVPYYQAYPQALNTPGNWPRQALRVPEAIGPIVEKRLAKIAAQEKQQGASVATLLQRKLWGLVHFFVKKGTSFDVHEFPVVDFPGLSRHIGKVTFAEIPMAGLLTLLYGAVLPKRLEMARRREQPGELTKEYNDVLVRDALSFFLLVFASNPLVRWINGRMMQPMAGLPLVRGLGINSYSSMEEQFAIRSPQTLQALLTHPDTREGFLKAARRLEDKGLSKLGFTGLKDAIQTFQKQVEAAVKHPRPEAYAEAFETLNRMDALVGEAGQQGLKTLAQKTPVESAVQLVRRAANVASSPSYKDFLVQYAKSYRLPGDMAALAVACVLAGWMPLALNDWISRRAVNKYLREHAGQLPPGGAAPAPAVSGPVPSGLHTNPAFQSFISA